MKISGEIIGNICANKKCEMYGKQQSDKFELASLACSCCGKPFGWVCMNCRELNPNNTNVCKSCGKQRELAYPEE